MAKGNRRIEVRASEVAETEMAALSGERGHRGREAWEEEEDET